VLEFKTRSWLEPLFWGPSAGSFWLNIHGPPGGVYAVEGSSDLRQWTMLRKIILDDFETSFQDNDAPVPGRFYRLKQAALSPMWLETPKFDANRAVQIVVHSEAGQSLRLDCSTNLVNWETLAQISNMGDTVQLADAASTNSMQRFYRAKYESAFWSRATPQQPISPRRAHFLFPAGSPPLPTLP